MASDNFMIGGLACKTGCKVQTIRYHEQIGQHCQTNLNRPAKVHGKKHLGHQFTPLGHCSGPGFLDDFAAG